MKSLFPILLITFFIQAYKSNSQSFEGTLTYKVDYEFSSDKMSDKIKKQIFNGLKAKGEYYDTISVVLKNGNYTKIDNAPNGKKVVYKADLNTLFFFQKNSTEVLVTQADIYNPLNTELPKPLIVKKDSIVKIGNYQCESLQLIWEGMGDEIYYFDPKVFPINPQLFEKHNYEYLNSILKETKAYPIKITKRLNEFMSLDMTLVRYEETKIQSNHFTIPELKKSNNEQYKTLEQATGYKMMIIK